MVLGGVREHSQNVLDGDLVLLLLHDVHGLGRALHGAPRAILSLPLLLQLDLDSYPLLDFRLAVEFLEALEEILPQR